jgi:hypothetical protein
MSNSPTTRRLKVAPHYVRLHPSLKITSSLRLAGDWLLRAGFRPGDVASVEVSDGHLTIRRVM